MDKLEKMKLLQSTAQWHLHDFDIAKTELIYVTTEIIFGADSRFTKAMLSKKEAAMEKKSEWINDFIN